MNRVTLLAHQGGWDEILLVAGPVMLFAGLVAIARRRAEQIATEREPEADSESS